MTSHCVMSILVSSRRDFGQFTGFYYPPGGHVENNEDEITALKREIQEELSLNITKAQKIAKTEGDIKDQITSWYLCECENYDFTVDDQELADAKFFTRDQIESMNIWPATKNVFEEYILKN